MNLNISQSVFLSFVLLKQSILLGLYVNCINHSVHKLCRNKRDAQGKRRSDDESVFISSLLFPG